jgi:hypothetical protein
LDSREKAVMYNAGKLAGEQFAKTLLKAGLKEKELKLALEISLTNGGWGEVRPLPCLKLYYVAKKKARVKGD